MTKDKTVIGNVQLQRGNEPGTAKTQVFADATHVRLRNVLRHHRLKQCVLMHKKQSALSHQV